MPSWIEARLACQGLLRLVLFKPDFTRYFDMSARGAARSFWIALPYYLYYLWVIWPREDNRVDDVALYVATMSAAYPCLWLLPAAVIAWIAPLAGRDAEMPGAIALYNWLTVATFCIYFPIALLYELDAPTTLLETLTFFGAIVTGLWEAFMLSRVLRIQFWQGAVFSFADYFFSQRLLVPMIHLSAGGH